MFLLLVYIYIYKEDKIHSRDFWTTWHSHCYPTTMLSSYYNYVIQTLCYPTTVCYLLSNYYVIQTLYVIQLLCYPTIMLSNHYNVIQPLYVIQPLSNHYMLSSYNVIQLRWWIQHRTQLTRNDPRGQNRWKSQNRGTEQIEIMNPHKQLYTRIGQINNT